MPFKNRRELFSRNDASSWEVVTNSGGLGRSRQPVEFEKRKNENDGTTFLLTVFDVFSKVAWCIPLKNKSALSMVAAFNTLLVDIAPTTLQSDKGLEFLNRRVQTLFRNNGIHYFLNKMSRPR